MTFHNALNDIPDPEVVPTAKRRKFTAEYKQRVLEEADNCTKLGQVVALDDQGKPYSLVSVKVADTYHTETIAQMFDYCKSNRWLTQHAHIPRLKDFSEALG